MNGVRLIYTPSVMLSVKSRSYGSSPNSRISRRRYPVKVHLRPLLVVNDCHKLELHARLVGFRRS